MGQLCGWATLLIVSHLWLKWLCWFKCITWFLLVTGAECLRQGWSPGVGVSFTSAGWSGCVCVCVCVCHRYKWRVFCCAGRLCPYALLSGPCRDLWRGRCSKYKRGTWNTLSIGLCCLLICVSTWMLLYWYSSKCHDAGLKRNTEQKRTILSLNVKDIFCTS